MNSPFDDLKSLTRYILIYQAKKTKALGKVVEDFKDFAVGGLMLKRGRFQKHVWHSAMIALAVVGIITSGVIGGNSIVASTLPGIGDNDPRSIQTYDPLSQGPNQNFLVNLKTSVSQKPRSEIIEYEVKSGDTLSGIAQKENISVDTIKWANDLSSVDSVKPGDTLKILPVSGVAVTVKSGDTLAGLAKKYQADSQAILDYPFNDIPDNFKLSAGQLLIIPDGAPPEVKAPTRSTQYLAQGSGSNSPAFSAPLGGAFIWPTQSVGISQYFAWYHPGIDLPNPSLPPLYASDKGVVIYAGWDSTGYGNRVDIDHGNGYTTRYAHLSNIYVVLGQAVSRGQNIGRMGSTGRSTGPHLHFEIHFKGIAINPLAILH